MSALRRSHAARRLTVIGWREYVTLPDLQIYNIKAKIDTGARTSALHALDLTVFERDGVNWTAFSVPSPVTGEFIRCSAPVVDVRAIKNTSGVPETRHIVGTALIVGRRRWTIEVSLTDRTEMGFDLILGRQAIRGHNFHVNPGKSFVAGKPEDLSTVPVPTQDEGVFRTLGRGNKSTRGAPAMGVEE